MPAQDLVGPETVRAALGTTATSAVYTIISKSINGRDGKGRVGTVGRAGLALAVVAVVVARDERGVDGDGVGDGAAEAVACESHVVCLFVCERLID